MAESQTRQQFPSLCEALIGAVPAVCGQLGEAPWNQDRGLGPAWHQHVGHLTGLVPFSIQSRDFERRRQGRLSDSEKQRGEQARRCMGAPGVGTQVFLEDLDTRPVMVHPVNLVRFRITMETHAWEDLPSRWGSASHGLRSGTEQK